MSNQYSLNTESRELWSLLLWDAYTIKELFLEGSLS